MKRCFSHVVLPLLAVAMTLASAGCSSTMGPEEAAQWIEAYTPERILSGSSIRIDFVSAVGARPDSMELADRVLAFSPSVAGQAQWENDGKTLLFRPDKGALRPGRNYKCRVRMGRLFDRPLKDFVFSFATGEREAVLEIVGVGSASDASMAIVSGRLRFSEPVDRSLVTPDLIRCDLAGCEPSVDIFPTADGAMYVFAISGLKRDRSDTHARVSFDADRIGFGKSLQQKIVVPGCEAFKVLYARMTDDSDGIEIGFSAPLDEKQELEGLVAVDELRRVRLEREGATVRVRFDQSGRGRFTLRIAASVRSAEGMRLGREFSQQFDNKPVPPAVEIPLSGTILPDASHLILPFRAVNLAAVDVRVVKVYADNVLSFLQDNDLDGSYELRRYGRLVYHRTVRLDGDPKLDLSRWQNFSVDLSGLFRQEKGAIYRVRLSFRQAYSLYGAEDAAQTAGFPMAVAVGAEENAEWDEPEGYYHATPDDYDSELYQWKESNDPAKPSYYMRSSRFPEYNLCASNLGLIVKSAESGHLWTAVSDIVTAQPLSGVQVTAYDFQLRPLGGARTDGNGFADFDVSGRPFVVTATQGKTAGYLKVTSGREKSLSRFDVGGDKVRKGLKGFVYGERDVWRPADTVHLTLLVEDRLRKLPDNHPVTMEVYNPLGQFFERQTLKGGTDGFYTFAFVTREESPTGNWEARFTVGGETFRKAVRIETIKPNRLKINLTTGSEVLRAGDTTRIDVEAHWLTGPAAAGLPASVEMTLGRKPKPFAGYAGYLFSNPLVDFAAFTHDLGSRKLDSCGRMTLCPTLPPAQDAPGLLSADLVCRVEEAGGDASIVSRRVDCSPFEAYVGVRLGSSDFETDTELRFPVVTVDAAGRRLDGRKLSYTIYKIDWSWWWEHNDRNRDLGSFVQSSSAQVVASGALVSGERTELPFRVDYPGWGKYLVLVKDTEGGHLSGGIIFIDWPSWRGHSDKSDPNAVSMLSFSLDKRTYRVGDEASLYIPASAGGRALVSLENSAGVLSREWVATAPDRETVHKIRITREMTPNFYVHVTLLQPHRQTANDLPVRLYGVQPVTVSDPESLLEPVLEVPDVVRPQERFTVKVKEKQGRPMTYTLAIVDEGLLDITGFRTPDPWGAMNRREALGVRTWDLYDEVIGAFGGKFSKVLSIGGGDFGGVELARNREKRFNPVVRFMGPFTLKGGAKSHRIELPMYVGSVRAMVVAGGRGAYGNAEKTVVVRAPLMIVPTLPRRLACGEQVAFPVNVFAMEPDVRNVQVSVRVEGPVEIDDAPSRKLTFTAPADRMVDFSLRTHASQEGTARVTVTARSGNFTATETIAIEVKNPNPPVTVSSSRVLKASESCDFEWAPFRSDAAGSAQLEIAAFPAIDFGGVFEYVGAYSHLCSEQLASRALGLLGTRRFLDAERQREAETMIRAILRELWSRQLPDGGFVYWPGSGASHLWVTSMAGQVLLAAQEEGFSVPAPVRTSWLAYQRHAARNYRSDARRHSDLDQAYRLYTLALAREADAGAMNRLRESGSLADPARWCLASAYAVAGKRDAAVGLVRTPAVGSTSGSYATFDSPLRNKALKLTALAHTRSVDEALALASQIADEFSTEHCTTQEMAFVCMAMGRLADIVSAASGEIRFVQPGGRAQQIEGLRAVACFRLDPAAGKVHVDNRSAGTLSVRSVVWRRPDVTVPVPAASEGVALTVEYTGLDGSPIDAGNLRQGQEFRAVITVRETAGNGSSESMALVFSVPSGWEIWNDRLYAQAAADSPCDYKEIRDDRVGWYFPLAPGQQKRFSVRLRAAYSGRFLLPAVVCEDMYDTHRCANTAGGRTEVTSR